ncbi:hypothetical protein ACLOJK_009148 [Asimina triloba]
MVIRVMKMVKEEIKNDQMYKFWHEFDGLVLVMWEDTNIRLSYIGHQHLDDELMLDVQMWMSDGLGDYGYECGYTPVLFGWETSIEPKLAGKKLDEGASVERVETKGSLLLT